MMTPMATWPMSPTTTVAARIVDPMWTHSIVEYAEASPNQDLSI
jgi:hypothetical protein